MTQTALFAAEDGAPCALIAGCDEVGRGPWAGPVVAAAVILDDDFRQRLAAGCYDAPSLSPGELIRLNASWATK